MSQHWGENEDPGVSNISQKDDTHTHLSVKDTSCISYFIVARNCLAQPHAYVAMVVDAASAVEFRCAWKMRISARGSCDSCARI
jgi:hypothetical protein